MKALANLTKYKNALQDCKQIIFKACEDLDLAIELGPSRGIFFNGVDEDGHEPFILERQLDQNNPFNFCKTNQKPYDKVVTACLIVLSFYMEDLVQISSSGNVDDWQEGLELARSVLPKDHLEIPPKINRGEEEL